MYLRMLIRNPFWLKISDQHSLRDESPWILIRNPWALVIPTRYNTLDVETWKNRMETWRRGDVSTLETWKNRMVVLAFGHKSLLTKVKLSQLNF